jgi:putative ABC transport system permease protein
MAMVDALPILGDRSPIVLTIDGVVAGPDDARPTAIATAASHDLDRTLGLRMMAGEWWRDGDAGVAVIFNETARRYFAGNAIGRRISINQVDNTLDARIVGVVSDIANTDRTELPPPRVFVPLDPGTPRFTYLVRADHPATLVSHVRAIVAANAAAVPTEYLQTFEDALAQAASSDYTVVGMLAGFALLALVLASTGLFGVVSYTVAQRTAEFGTRMALGARAIDVVNLVARESARLLAIGLSIGLTAGVGVGFTMKSVLYGLSPVDPATMSFVIGLLAAVTMTATAIPAWRASRIDPVIALRAE